MTSGVVVVDKPRGPTSHDVVAMVRRALKTREVGHAGTLDPMATGVLVVAIGEATKLVPYLTDDTKEYEARVELGRETDTLDALGKVMIEQDVPDTLRKSLGPAGAASRFLEEAVAAELARTLQDPPIYSAIQQNGERAYVKARRGEEVVLAARPVRVHRLVVLAAGLEPAPWLDVLVKADKGYYVRSLGRDLARGLGTVGHLTALRRIASGSFADTDAVAPPLTREALLERLLPLPDAARRVLPDARLSTAGVVTARFGRRVPLDEFDAPGPQGMPAAWSDAAGRLVAVGVQEEESGRVLRGFQGT